MTPVNSTYMCHTQSSLAGCNLSIIKEDTMKRKIRIKRAAASPQWQCWVWGQHSAHVGIGVLHSKCAISKHTNLSSPEHGDAAASITSYLLGSHLKHFQPRGLPASFLLWWKQQVASVRCLNATESRIARLRCQVSFLIWTDTWNKSSGFGKTSQMCKWGCNQAKVKVHIWAVNVKFQLKKNQPSNSEFGGSVAPTPLH